MMSENELPKILPCPFCGFKSPHISAHPGTSGFRDRYSVLCDYQDGGCGADGSWHHERADAVEAWNQRYDPRIQCKSCRYRSDANVSVCRNPDSPHEQDYVDDDDYCAYWTALQ